MDESDDETQHSIRCRACDRELDQGMDVTILQEGVLGPRGFVPLEEIEYFCGWKCFERHVCDPPIEKLRRRVP